MIMRGTPDIRRHQSFNYDADISRNVSSAMASRKPMTVDDLTDDQKRIMEEN
jgi:hypothetical protein